jgi:hypothetical protein
MSQVIENGTDLVTRIVGKAGPSTIPGHDLLAVDVLAARAVDGKADVLSARVGQRLDLSVRRGQLPAADLAGHTLHVRASMVGPGVVRAEPLPGAATFEPQPPAG